MIRIFTILLLSLLFCQHSFAQWTNDITVNTEVSDIAGSEQSVPYSVTTSNGLTYISWFDNSSGAYQLRMQLLDAKGNKLWKADGNIISDKPQNSAIYRYDLKLDNNDNAIVAFQDERTGVLQIVAYKIDQNGNNLWGSDGVQLIDSTSNEGLSPTIGITDKNEVIIAWNAYDNSNKWIAYNKLSSDGIAQWDTIHRIKDISAKKKYSRPTVIPAKGIGFYLLYAEEAGGFGLPPSTMYSQLYDDAGVNYWQTPLLVSSKKIPFFFFPDPVSDNNGGFFIAYNTSNPDVASLNDVYVQRITTTGVLFGPDGVQACNSNTNFKSLSGSIYLEDKDQFWVLIRMQDVNQSLSGVYVQSIKGNGVPVFAANGIEVLPISSDFYIPVAISNSKDGLALIYTESAVVTNDLIKAIKIDYLGTPLWSPEVLPLSIITSNKFNITIGDFVNNQAVIVWQDSRLDYGIYAQNITSEGTTSVSEPSNNNMELSLYPNPSNQAKLYIKLVENGNAVISVYNISGNLINSQEKHLDAGYNTLVMKDDNLSPGTYFIEVLTTKAKEIIKWVKN